MKLYLDRLLKKVKKEDTGCWFYRTAPSQRYAYIRVGNKKLKAHRFMYLYFKGEIPRGEVVMHTCHNKKCINPDHLKAGSQKENVQDSVKAGLHMKNYVPAHGLRGVHWKPERKMWLATRTLNGKTNTLYYGPDFFEAVCARKSFEASLLRTDTVLT